MTRSEVARRSDGEKRRRKATSRMAIGRDEARQRVLRSVRTCFATLEHDLRALLRAERVVGAVWGPDGKRRASAGADEDEGKGGEGEEEKLPTTRSGAVRVRLLPFRQPDGGTIKARIDLALEFRGGKGESVLVGARCLDQEPSPRSKWTLESLTVSEASSSASLPRCTVLMGGWMVGAPVFDSDSSRFLFAMAMDARFAAPEGLVDALTAVCAVSAAYPRSQGGSRAPAPGE